MRLPPKGKIAVVAGFLVLGVIGNMIPAPEQLAQPVSSSSPTPSFSPESEPSPEQVQTAEEPSSNALSESEASDPFIALLNEADPKCTESLEQLGRITEKAVELAREKGVFTTRMEMIKGLLKVQEGYEGEQECAGVYSLMVVLMTKEK